jgi:hypothetical protein
MRAHSTMGPGGAELGSGCRWLTNALPNISPLPPAPHLPVPPYHLAISPAHLLHSASRPLASPPSPFAALSLFACRFKRMPVLLQGSEQQPPHLLATVPRRSADPLVLLHRRRHNLPDYRYLCLLTSLPMHGRIAPRQLPPPGLNASPRSEVGVSFARFMLSRSCRDSCCPAPAASRRCCPTTRMACSVPLCDVQ